MIANEERKKIAKRLRNFRWDVFAKNDSDFREVLDKLIDIDYYDKHTGILYSRGATWERLADLIDPICEMYRDEHGIWHCKSCESGADKIMGSNGEMDEWCDSWHPVFCPYCGKRVKS